MEQIQSALSPKEKSRIETILEIIEKAKKLKAKDPDC